MWRVLFLDGGKARIRMGVSLHDYDLAADETGTVNLYSGANEPESFIAFIGDERGQLDGYILVIANPKYNPYEDTIEMAEWTLLRIIPDIEAAEAE